MAQELPLNILMVTKTLILEDDIKQSNSLPLQLLHN